MSKNLELTLDLYEILIPRIIDISLGGDNWFSIDQDESLPDYNRFVLNENLAKPSLKRIEREFYEYKKELISQLRNEIYGYYKQMKYPKIGLLELGIKKSPKKYLRDIYELEDVSLVQGWLEAYNAGMQKKEQEEREKQLKRDRIYSMINSEDKLTNDQLSEIVRYITRGM